MFCAEKLGCRCDFGCLIARNVRQLGGHFRSRHACMRPNLFDIKVFLICFNVSRYEISMLRKGHCCTGAICEAYNTASDVMADVHFFFFCFLAFIYCQIPARSMECVLSAFKGSQSRLPCRDQEEGAVDMHAATYLVDLGS